MVADVAPLSGRHLRTTRHTRRTRQQAGTGSSVRVCHFSRATEGRRLTMAFWYTGGSDY